MKKLTEKRVYCFTAWLLLYLVHYEPVANLECSEYAVPHITLVTNQKLDLSEWRDHLFIHVVTLPEGNLSFYDVTETTQKVLRAIHDKGNSTSAIIGSGDTIIDGLIARTIGHLTVPFISITRNDNHQVTEFKVSFTSLYTNQEGLAKTPVHRKRKKRIGEIKARNKERIKYRFSNVRQMLCQKVP